MTGQQQAKKHHFVPRCYLKNFVRDGKVCVLNVRKVTTGINHYVKAVSPKAICFLEDFYKIKPNDLNLQFKLDAHDELFVESKILKNLEDRYAKTLFDNLINCDYLSLREASDMSDFIIQIKLRNPYWLSESMKTKDKTIDSAMKSLYDEKFHADERFAHLPMEIKRSVADYVKQQNKSNPDFTKMMQLYALIQRASDISESNSRVKKAIIDCEWKIFIAPDQGPKFITSDNPGFATAKDNLNYNTKFTDGFVFFFPLSPDYCLIIGDAALDHSLSRGHTVKKIQKIEVEAAIVIMINDKAIQRVNELLIASDDWYLSQIAARNRPL